MALKTDSKQNFIEECDCTNEEVTSKILSDEQLVHSLTNLNINSLEYEQDLIEEPVDYSKKYAEMKTFENDTYLLDQYTMSDSEQWLNELDKFKKPLQKQTTNNSSRSTSPEKPINYCEEDTLLSFTCCCNCSKSSLNSADEDKTLLMKNNLCICLKNIDTELNSAKNVCYSARSAEQTPLMFSRSSSLESLNSFEQHSIHDDYSSVVSEFSRLASGIVSPSELPDSPTQNLPVSRSISPRLVKPIAVSQQPVKSVFDDDLIEFKDINSPPVEFPSNTSLSSLTINDDSNEKSSSLHEDEDNLNEKEESDMLTACINMGIETHKLRNKKLNVTTTKKHLTVLECSEEDSTKIYCTENTPSLHGSTSNLSALSINSANSNKHDQKLKTTKQDVYGSEICSNTSSSSSCSHTSSSNNLSADNDINILAECIKSGMPKTKNITELLAADNDLNLFTPSLFPMISPAESFSSLLEQCISSGMPSKKAKGNRLGSGEPRNG